MAAFQRAQGDESFDAPVRQFWDTASALIMAVDLPSRMALGGGEWTLGATQRRHQHQVPEHRRAPLQHVDAHDADSKIDVLRV